MILQNKKQWVLSLRPMSHAQLPKATMSTKENHLLKIRCFHPFLGQMGLKWGFDGDITNMLCRYDGILDGPGYMIRIHQPEVEPFGESNSDCSSDYIPLSPWYPSDTTNLVSSMLFFFFWLLLLGSPVGHNSPTTQPSSQMFPQSLPVQLSLDRGVVICFFLWARPGKHQPAYEFNCSGECAATQLSSCVYIEKVYVCR